MLGDEESLRPHGAWHIKTIHHISFLMVCDVSAYSTSYTPYHNYYLNIHIQRCTYMLTSPPTHKIKPLTKPTFLQWLPSYWSPVVMWFHYWWGSLPFADDQILSHFLKPLNKNRPWDDPSKRGMYVLRRKPDKTMIKVWKFNIIQHNLQCIYTIHLLSPLNWILAILRVVSL